MPTHGRFARLRNSTNNTRKILIEHRVVKSRAYASLSSAARVVLIEMMRRDNGSNNGRIKFGAEDGVFVRLGYDVTKRAMRELHAAGFIIMTVAANKYRGIPRKWRLTMIKTNGEAATFDFLKRPPENVIPVSQTPLNPPDGLSGAPELVSDGAMDAGSNHVHEHQDGQDPQRVASDSPARGGHGDEGEVWGRQTDTYRIPGSGDPPPAAASAAGRTRHRPAHEIEKLRGGATLHRLPMRHSPDDDPPMKSRALTNDRRGSRPRMRGKADD